MSQRPIGEITRGTTHPNRLRRVDRWLVHRAAPLLGRVAQPTVVDLGFGASPVTTCELAQRLPAQVRVVGLEVDPQRVAQARGSCRAEFALGGFELGPEAGRAHVVRAFNVLRQYDEADVGEAWRTMAAGLAPGGFIVEGTCDELGRLASWVRVEADGAPSSLTISLRLAGLARPSDVAARLPKALIHRNVEGEAVHRFLSDLDRAWAAAAPWGDLGARQRWRHTLAALADYPVLDGPDRWRLGEVTVGWSAVAPDGS